MKDSKEQIWKYIDGDLSLDEKATLDALLSSDQDFKREMMSSHHLDVLLKSEINEGPSLDFLARIQKSVLDEFAIIEEKLWRLSDFLIVGGMLVLGIVLLMVFINGQQQFSFSNFESASGVWIWTIMLMAGSLFFIALDSLLARKISR